MKAKILILLSAVLVTAFCLSASAEAARSHHHKLGCYTPAEYEAEQGIRIHSELMVIGLTCQKMPGDQDLYAKYREFTLKNSGLLSHYETELLDYYRREGVKNPEKHLHNLRTRMANRISQYAVNNRVSSFCEQFSGRIDTALKMSKSTLRAWAQHKWPNQPSSEPECKS